MQAGMHATLFVTTNLINIITGFVRESNPIAAAAILVDVLLELAVLLR
jgi:translation elongation factor P/translation initiation factor 5A